MVYEFDEFPVGEAVLELFQGGGQAAVVPLVVLGVLGVEDFPQFVSLDGVVPRDGAHVGELVPHCDDFGVVRGGGQAVHRGLLAGVPAVLLAHALLEDVAFGHHQGGDAVSEFAADFIGRYFRVLHHVVQGGGGQELLVGGDGGDDFHGLHRMDDVGEALSAALGAGVGLDREDDGAVQKFCIEGFVGHITACS